MKILTVKICGLSILAMAFTFAASAQNLLVNGGFDSPSSIGSPNQIYNTESYWYFSQRNPSELLGGNWTYAQGNSSFDALVNDSVSSSDYFVSLGGGGNAAGGSINQSFDATAGSIYIASLDVGYVGNYASYWSFGIRFSILDTANQIVGFYEVTNSSINFPTTPFTFATYSFQFEAPSTNLAFKVEDITTSSSDTDVLINSASVVAVPEPSTYTLLATGLLIVFWTFLRRRRTSCSSTH
jgi:hypothetical protein